MKPRIIGVVVLALFMLLALVACDVDDTAQPTCVEFDIDHPKAKTKRPTAPKAPAYRAPTKRR
jgi:hypothetical protein